MPGTYEELKVWRRSMDLVLQIYRSTASFPKQEIYGLTSQMRRAAVSIPSNIAEAKGVSTAKSCCSSYSMPEGPYWSFRPRLLSDANWAFYLLLKGRNWRT